MAIQISVLLALLLFLIIFISVDNKLKRNQENELLKHEKSWIDYKRTLPKYVP